MEPNYSRHALIQAFCLSITRGVTLAFQSPSICFEICDNQSRLPFVTTCSVWCGGEESMAHSYGGVSFPQLKTLLLCSLSSPHINDNNSVCLRLCSASCSNVESEEDQTVSKLPCEGCSCWDRVEKAKYSGSNSLLCLSHNEAATEGLANTHRMLRYRLRVRCWSETRAEKTQEELSPRPFFFTCPFLCVRVFVFPHHEVIAVIIPFAEIIPV